jgi:hypothetical protein
LDLYRTRIRLTADDTKTGKGRGLFLSAGTADLLRKVYRKRNPKARLSPAPDRAQDVPSHPDQRSRHPRRSHARPLPLPGQEVADLRDIYRHRRDQPFPPRPTKLKPAMDKLVISAF